MAAAQPPSGDGPLPERQIIRDAIAEQLTADGFVISTPGPYTIRLHPCNDRLAGRSPFEIINLPAFSIDFNEDAVVVVVARATSTRILAILDYADPGLLDTLATTLAEIGVCLAPA